MLYYLTGMATERSAVLAYNLLQKGVAELGETAVAETIVAQIRRQEPGHYAFYKMSALGLAEQLTGWQKFLVRHMRRISFAPVGANNAEQKADFGDLVGALGIDHDLESFADPDLPGRARAALGPGPGMRVPDYVLGGVPRGRRAGPGPRRADRLARLAAAPAPRSRRCRRRSRPGWPTAA